MKRVWQANTSAEGALRRALCALGLRYPVQLPVIAKPRRVADVAVVGPRLAVFVDGCFWYGCPLHATWPKNNAEFWRSKTLANQARDRDTDARLIAKGWEGVSVWATWAPAKAAAQVADLLRRRRPKGAA